MISNERFKTFFLNWWKMSEKDMELCEMEDLCKDIGMTRGEFIELVSQSNEFITKSGWTPPEPEANEKVDTETGEGVFWKAYTEEEEDEEISESSEKSTPVPDYFRFIEMLEGANVSFAKYLNSTEKTIEIKDGYDAIDFIFDEETFKLKEVSF